MPCDCKQEHPDSFCSDCANHDHEHLPAPCYYKKRWQKEFCREQKAQSKGVV